MGNYRSSSCVVDSLPGVPAFTVDSDVLDYVKLRLEEQGGLTEWKEAVVVIKELVPEYGAAKASSLVVEARRNPGITSR